MDKIKSVIFSFGKWYLIANIISGIILLVLFFTQREFIDSLIARNHF